jgi:carbon-monoxide dehydrogenase small subunit
MYFIDDFPSIDFPVRKERGMQERVIRLMVNEEKHDIKVPVNRTLLQVLREDLGLTDTKHGCGAGECGACTVLINGKKAILSCLSLAATMDDSNITTVRHLAKDGELHPVQTAFIEEGAIQCGYCTPGMVMKTVSLLAEYPNIKTEEIKRGLEGNLCRCTGYIKIIRAVERARDMITKSEK